VPESFVRISAAGRQTCSGELARSKGGRTGRPRRRDARPNRGMTNPSSGGEPMEYLVTMTTHVPEGTSDDAVDAIRAREAARSRQLAGEGRLLRLWRPPLQPGEWRTLGLFAADNAVELETILSSMPLRVWRTDEPTPLSPHPNDPAANEVRSAPLTTGSGAEFLTTFTVAVPKGMPAERVA